MKKSKDLVVHFQGALSDPDEIWAAGLFLSTYKYISSLPTNSLVAPRYTVLPFKEDYFSELKYFNITPINSLEQFNYVANLWNWYHDLKDFTPKTYKNLASLPDKGTSFILKGATNSRKSQWNTHMFAKDKEAARAVFEKLVDDSLIGQQDIYIREYFPLYTYTTGINGLPITKEFRFFFYKTRVLASGFYWDSHTDCLDELPLTSEVPLDLVQSESEIISKNVNFFVVDFAQTAVGEWIVVEVNSGEMSGLACCDPAQLYSNLRKAVEHDA